MEKNLWCLVFVSLVFCHSWSNGDDDDTYAAKKHLYQGVPYVILQSRSVGLPNKNVANSRDTEKDFQHLLPLIKSRRSQDLHKLPRNAVPQFLSNDFENIAGPSSNRAYAPATELWSREPQLHHNNQLTPEDHMEYDGNGKHAQNLYSCSNCKDNVMDDWVPNGANQQTTDLSSSDLGSAYRTERRVKQPSQSLQKGLRKTYSQPSSFYSGRQFGNNYMYPYYPYFGYFYYPMGYYGRWPLYRTSSRTSRPSSGTSSRPSSGTSSRTYSKPSSRPSSGTSSRTSSRPSSTPLSKLSSRNFHSDFDSKPKDIQTRIQHNDIPTTLTSNNNNNNNNSVKCDCNSPECQNCEQLSSPNCSCCCKKNLLTLHVHLLHLKPQSKKDVYDNFDDSVRRSLRTISTFDKNDSKSVLNVESHEEIASNKGEEGGLLEEGTEELTNETLIEYDDNDINSDNSTKLLELNTNRVNSTDSYDIPKKNIQFNNFLFFIFPDKELFRKEISKFGNKVHYHLSNDERENLIVKDEKSSTTLDDSLSPSAMHLLASLNLTAIEKVLNHRFSNRNLLDNTQWSKVDGKKKSWWGHEVV